MRWDSKTERMQEAKTQYKNAQGEWLGEVGQQGPHLTLNLSKWQWNQKKTDQQKHKDPPPKKAKTCYIMRKAYLGWMVAINPFFFWWTPPEKKVASSIFDLSMRKCRFLCFQPPKSCDFQSNFKAQAISREDAHIVARVASSQKFLDMTLPLSVSEVKWISEI